MLRALAAIHCATVTQQQNLQGQEATSGGAGRTYEVRTFGCQMNVHDSERLSGMLERAGYVAAEQETEADLVVFNTCAVRELSLIHI